MNIMDQKAPLKYAVTDLLATEISACPAFVETLQLFADRQLHLSLLIETATISGFSFLQGFSDLARPSVNLSTADAIAPSPSSHALSCLAPKTVLNLSREVLIHILPMILKPPDPGRGCRVALMHSRSSSVMLRCLVLHVPPLDLELPAHPYSTSSGDRVWRRETSWHGDYRWPAATVQETSFQTLLIQCTGGVQAVTTWLGWTRFCFSPSEHFPSESRVWGILSADAALHLIRNSTDNWNIWNDKLL